MNTEKFEGEGWRTLWLAIAAVLAITLTWHGAYAELERIRKKEGRLSAAQSHIRDAPPGTDGALRAKQNKIAGSVTIVTDYLSILFRYLSSECLWEQP
jgi:hypothetical protein